MPPSPATAGALGAISLLCFVLVGVTWDQRRVTPLATPLSALFLAIGWWNGSYALFLAETPSPSPDFWVLTCYVGVVAIPPAVLVFALRFAGWDRWPGRGAATALLVEPAVVLVVLASNERYRLLFGDERAPERIATADGGAVFWLNSVYSYVLLTVSLVLVARVFWSGRGVRRRQAGAVLIALLVPWLVSLILLAPGLPEVDVDLTPPSQAVSMIAIAIAVFRYRILEVTPVARHALFDFMDDAVVVLDGHDRITDLNPAAARVFDIDRTAVLGSPITDPLARELGLLSLLAASDDTRAEASLAAQPGRTVEARVTLLPDRPGHDVGRLVVCRDITDFKRLEEELARLAMRDPLTGVGNRRALEADWTRESARSRRSGTALACALLDLDNFKRLNDTAGHAAGDRALIEFARAIEQKVRRLDSVARIGGDEFVVLMPGTSPEKAVRVVRRIAAEYEHQAEAYSLDRPLSLSAGVAAGTSDDLSTVLAAADRALYQAKQSGRGQIHVA